jgi:uncharacterized membrane protein
MKPKTIFAVLCTAALLCGSQARAAIFKGIETLSGSFNYTILSADGSTVVGNRYIDHVAHAYRWTSETGTVNLRVLPGHVISYSRAISADGSVVVGGSYDEYGDCLLFRWTAETRMVGIET